MSRLTSEQLAAVEDRGGQILVSAAAGSGKTRVLVERLLGYVLAGEDIDRFLIITYTNAAAAELRGKIMDAVYERIGADPANMALRRQAELLRRAHIETIHSFCGGIIRENAHKLGVQPDFRVADEAEARMLKDGALSELLDELYDSGDRDFYALADTMGAGRDDSALMDVILDTHVKLLSHPSPSEWVEKQLKLLSLQGVTDIGATVWGREIMARARRAAVYWAEQMEYLTDEAAADPKVEKGYGESFRATLRSLRSFISALDGTWDTARAASAIDFPTGRLSGYDELKAVRNRCKKEMGKISALFWDDSEKAIEDMRAVAPASMALLRTVLRFDGVYAEAKRRRGVLDFSDQEHLALRALVDINGAPTDTARAVAARFTEIMVDEYQDVNLIQETIFGAVSRMGRNIFTVGDVKQSIYRFRLADPTIFLKKYLTFAEAGAAADGEPRKIVLSKNFRSGKGILDATNFIFQNCMSGELGEIDYTQREYLRPGLPVSEPAEPEVELDILDMSGGDEEDAEDAPGKSEAEAFFAAGRIKELVSSSVIPDGNGGVRPVRYGDIAILMRSPRSALPVWQQIFAAEGIPLAADKPSDFFTRHEVSLTLSLLSVIDNPRQDIPLISVMRSPIYGFTSQELAGIRLYDREGDFWQAVTLAAREDEKCRKFVEELRRMRLASPDMTAEELLWYVFGRTELFAHVAAMPEGRERKESLMLLIELAHTCESSGYRGLFGFLSYLQRMREKGDGPDMPDRDPGDAVRIMSVHKSKGLEFPVVILAELTHRFNTEDTRARLLIHPELGVGPKLTDTKRRVEYYTVARRAVMERLRREMLSEELRVLYVAMTRARDKLVMLVTYSDAEREVAKLANAPLPVPAELLAGCRSMAEWILLPALRRPESDAIRFGIPNVPCDTEGDPWAVRLVSAGAPSGGEAPRTEPEAPRHVEVSEELRDRLGYVYPYKAATAMPSKVTATELKGAYKDVEANEEAAAMSADDEKAMRPPTRPQFMEGRGGLTPAQRGTAVHTVMQYADFDRCLTVSGAAEQIERLRANKTISDEQAASVRPQIISGFFATEPGKLILGAERLWRELKFSLLADSELLPGFAEGEKILLQGVIDCCVERDGKLTVIDFKTDYVTPETVDERARYYKGQLSAYALALERMMKMPVERKIVCFLTAGCHRDV